MPLFKEKSEIEQLAAEQGVSVVTDFNALLGNFWPEDESADDFITQVRAWRLEDKMTKTEREAMEANLGRPLTEEEATLADELQKVRNEFVEHVNALANTAKQALSSWTVLATSASLLAKIADKLSVEEVQELTDCLARLSNAIMPKDINSVQAVAKEFVAAFSRAVEEHTIPKV